mmetsp:Transcript_33078/g.72125  ORF Transcript_33078/g.72125 Transcript_33078/m.72125 type:complete len:112 (+) Transcript_33078:306-641(+)|eukprot:CAMPEP_0118943904 /NCGR_PEP_ID=MMETSP1169-20130426/39264_1 /TAXON_ID=36882 /ORGANISM="Pyramimonas obovata, Strain CCMP722" /LENGTH=111 /DNA_ID=CAMNT_0006889265 /DNA_START=300 /DNA_END=635 /DNA_ORIENTATION=-
MCGENDEISKFVGASWSAQYDRLKAYKQVHGHTNVDPDKDKALYKWANAQRQAAKTMFLNPQHKALLDNLGFDWTKPNSDKQKRSRFSGLMCWSSPQVDDKNSAVMVAKTA